MLKDVHLIEKDRTSINTYFSEVNHNSKLLSKDQEIELSKLMDSGRWRDANGELDESKIWRDDIDDISLRRAKKAREKLIQSNLRLVVSVARSHQNKGCDLEDLIQEGNVGLIDGINRYDYTKGFKVSTYATWWIRQRIERLISNHGKTVRVPIHVQNLTLKLKPILDAYSKEFNSSPSISDIMRLLECSEDMARAALDAAITNQTITLDHPSINSNDETDMHSYFEDENNINPLDIISNQELMEVIREAISELSPRDEKILRLRFGITEDPKDHNNWGITYEEMSNLNLRKNKENI